MKRCGLLVTRPSSDAVAAKGLEHLGAPGIGTVKSGQMAA